MIEVGVLRNVIANAGILRTCQLVEQLKNLAFSRSFSILYQVLFGDRNASVNLVHEQLNEKRRRGQSRVVVLAS